jgi:hypothetical protein
MVVRFYLVYFIYNTERYKMINLKTLFSDALNDIKYYRGGLPCCFYPEMQWRELCHIMPRSKTNMKACAKVFGDKNMIDLPLINVLPGSRYANHEGYCVVPKKVLFDVYIAAQKTLEQYNKKYVSITSTKTLSKNIYAAFYNVNIDVLLKAQEEYQYLVRNAFKVEKI